MAKRSAALALFSSAVFFAAILLMVVHFSTSIAEAAQATLSWNPTTTNIDGTTATDLAGYKIYIGNTPGNYQQTVDVGNQASYTLSGLNDGATYYFAVTAYNATGSESGYSNESSTTFPALPVTHVITATFGTGGTITADSNTNISQASNGTTTIMSVTVNDGASQSFRIAPAAGYRIADVKADGISVGPVSSYNFSNVTADHTIAASFALNSFTITASAGAGGSITPSGTATLNSGSNQTYTITPASGYRISDVKVDGVSVGPVTSYSFSSISANHTIAASFTVTSFTITASAGAGGSITPSGTATLNSGSNQTYTITPANGYRISDVKVDGISVGPVTSYSFSSISANHTIAASFYYRRGKR